jgi:hypothetical protein
MADQLAPNTAVDSRLGCRRCHKHLYTLFRVGVPGSAGTYVHRLWPAAPDVPPPSHPSRLTCPECGQDLVRLDVAKESF